MLWDEKLKKNTFCCYKCLDLYHAKTFFLVFVTCFPNLSSRNSVLKRSQILGLWPRTRTTFEELRKQVTYLEIFFLMANLDNYSNKILFLIIFSNVSETSFNRVHLEDGSRVQVQV